MQRSSASASLLAFYVLRAVGLFSTCWAAGLGHLLSGVLLTFPLAFAAIRVGQWLARRLGIAKASASGLFARAALIAGVFALFLAPASGPHRVLDRAFGTTPTHAFHGQSRSVESDRAVDTASIGIRGIRDATLGYLAAVPLMFLGLALLSGKNRDGRTNAERPDWRAQAARAQSVVPTAIALAVADVAASLRSVGRGEFRMYPTVSGGTQVWVPEFFGDVACVNGIAFPYLVIARFDLPKSGALTPGKNIGTSTTATFWSTKTTR